MSDWVFLDPKKFMSEESETDSVSLSPYDFPTAVRIDWDPSSKSAVLKFKYLTDEKTKPSSLGDKVTALFGQNSRRLYGLRINTETPDISVQNIKDEVKTAFEDLTSTKSGANANRYQVVQDMLDQNLTRLFPDEVAASAI